VTKKRAPEALDLHQIQADAALGASEAARLTRSGAHSRLLTVTVFANSEADPPSRRCALAT